MPRTHLRLTAPVASRALLPEDPGLALALAQELVGAPRMSNHTLGLWGYHGLDAEGEELTIQATGLGGAGAAIVLGELAEHGVRTAVRIGTCAAVEGGPPLGTGVAVVEALADDGVSRRLGAPERLAADRGLTAALVAAGAHPQQVATLDLPPACLPQGVDAADLASASLLACAARHGIGLACALVVAETAGGEALPDQELAERGLELGRSAFEALRSASISAPR